MPYSHLQLIDARDAEQVLADHVFVPEQQCLSLTDAGGRVLREDVCCDRDQPPFDRVMMDGIAFSYAVFEKGQRDFPVEGTQPAGEPAKQLAREDGCFEVMTGAVLPRGCDCVVPVEGLEVHNGLARVAEGVCCVRFLNVHRQGRDLLSGETVLSRGTVLGPAQMAALAAVGRTSVNVARLPRVAVLITGDELVGAGNVPLPYQIRSTNDLALSALLQRDHWGCPAVVCLPDDRTLIKQALERACSEHDIVLSSGGVSKGKMDFMAQVVIELGGELLVHGVKERPGKPFLFGLMPGKKPFFGLPGNPVSALVTAVRYLLPYLKRSFGLTAHVGQVVCDRDFVPELDLTYFIPVQTHCALGDGGPAKILDFSCSGDLFAFAHADGFVEFSRGEKKFSQGCRVPYYEF